VRGAAWRRVCVGGAGQGEAGRACERVTRAADGAQHRAAGAAATGQLSQPATHAL
jgi:hypothetical protein